VARFDRATASGGSAIPPAPSIDLPRSAVVPPPPSVPPGPSPATAHSAMSPPPRSSSGAQPYNSGGSASTTAQLPPAAGGSIAVPATQAGGPAGAASPPAFAADASAGSTGTTYGPVRPGANIPSSPKVTVPAKTPEAAKVDPKPRDFALDGGKSVVSITASQPNASEAPNIPGEFQVARGSRKNSLTASHGDGPPSLINPGAQDSTEGDSPDLQVVATDPDNNFITYSATGLPPGLSIDPTYGNLTGSINYGDAVNSPYAVTVTATNDRLSDSTSFVWSVTPPAPSIDNADDVNWVDVNTAENQPVSMPVLASDADNRQLSFSATGLPPGVAIDPITGVISGTVAPGDDTGTPYDVTVSVSNGYKATTLNFSWTITRLSLVTPPDRTNTVGDTVSLPIQASDPTDSTLSYSADGLPDGLSIDPNTGVISGTPDASAADGSSWQVLVAVHDGTATAEHSFDWKILPTVLPVISLVDPGFQINHTNDVISLPTQASATGVDYLSYSATGLPDGLAIDPTSGVISGMDDDFARPGYSTNPTTYTVTVTVADDYGQTAGQTFLWEFDPVAGISTVVLPGSFCPVPTILAMTSLDPNCNYGMFQSCTLTYRQPPAAFAPLSITGPLFLSTAEFFDPIANSYFYYHLFGQYNQFSLTRLYPTSPYGSPFRDGTLFTWLVGGYGNNCNPFYLHNGSSFPGSDATCQVLIDPGSGSALIGRDGGYQDALPSGVGGGRPQGIVRGAQGGESSGSHPQTEPRDDNFDVNAFWANVEKLPGGQAAEDWVARNRGQVNWGWTLSFTHGRYENDANGSSIPVVNIPWQNNEADAATKFVDCITQDWVWGFAAESKVPTDGNPVSWQAYIKERTKAQGAVVVAGAELYLSGLSIVSEGADWVVTISDISAAKTPGQVALASLGFLPFISGASIRVLSRGLKVVEATAFQQKLVTKFLSDYKLAGFGTRRIFDKVVNFKDALGRVDG